MTIAHSAQLNPQKPLRLWPGVVIVIVQWLARFGIPIVQPESLYIGVLGGVAGGLAVVVWWLFFSRAPWLDRLGAVGLMILALFVTPRFVDESISKGAMGMLFPVLAIPVLSLAFVAWAVFSRRLSVRSRRLTMVATILLACGAWTLVRTGGFTSDFDHDFAWRWAETAEERLLVQPQEEPTPELPDPPVVANPEQPPVQPEENVIAESVDVAPTVATAPVETKEAEWPGFRGPERDSVVRGVRIKSDWSASPPVELWRRPVGPGWSSFAVNGKLVYTQEQRGEHEVVTCYKISNGKPVWKHSDATRFWESNGGAGPRATPTLSNGRVYAFGATGIVNALNAADGKRFWSRNVATDTKTEVPPWGFASSPLVIDNVVIVAAAGQLAAYDINTGSPRWFGPKGGTDYSSPHLVNISGVRQILLMNRPGATSVAPATGEELWKFALPTGTRIVQPASITDGEVLISEGDQHGMRRIAVAQGTTGWTVKERWASIGLKPYFNDFVVHKGHAFGFDGSYLSCIDLQDGKRKWKGGRYGSGQMLLLADQDLLLVLSEQGDLALVSATPNQFTELARSPAIEGKTWNHPVLVGDTLLVRNAEEMAAFRLTRADN